MWREQVVAVIRHPHQLAVLTNLRAFRAAACFRVGHTDQSGGGEHGDQPHPYSITAAAAVLA